ncbi:hypothetical protein HPP92_026583 [Vanilla planifolia]|uniref:Uncharacterized protein n=1 Tax=Vanilla planifolia TaxID=51239 RepID=A0A835PFL8_VANPL|nr:hypothetical protein HPP92_026583 [Vanilla planifolia]
MGPSISYAAAPPQPVQGQHPVGLGMLLPPKSEEKAKEKVDWRNLPCPVPFEEIQREAWRGEEFGIAGKD